jgi:nicotinamidase-related amidase
MRIPPDAIRRQPRSLIAREDSLLCIIDVQPGFLAKIQPDAREQLIDTARFVIEVATRLAIPRFVTVEDPAHNGATVDTIRSCLASDDLERDKRVFGLGSQPDLASALLGQPRRTAILIGLETDVCVLHSAVSLAELGFRAVIVTDATGAPGGEHDLGLERARILGLETIHAKGLYYEWIRSLEGLAAITAGPAIRPPVGSVL